MKKKIVLCIVMLFILLLSGCQKTPDKSSVVSKADGLSKEVIADPLESEEKKTIDMPEHWSAVEKKSNDRVAISADLDLGKLETGNLPVVEMKNHTMTQKELKKLTEYFAGDEELYVPQSDTKEVFQKLIDRIDQREGAYGNASLGPFSDLKNSLKAAIKLAPETPPKEQKAKVKFQKKAKDEVWEAANSWLTILDTEKEQIPDIEAYFSADIGKNRQSHIEAECYNSDIANSSRFVWKTGTDSLNLEEIQQYIRMNERSTDTTGYKEKFRDRLDQYKEALEQQSFLPEKGQKQAEKVMKDLDVSTEMSLLSVDKVLWLPEEIVTDVKYGQGQFEDFYWQADPERAKAGYQYIFTRAFGGISSDRQSGVAIDEITNAYTSPFPVETVSITVTDEGIKTFSWIGMCEEVSVIAENVNLLPFEEIQKRLFEQIYYNYLEHEQPEEDTTNFTYQVISARLGYAYITAFNEPKDAWLVPAWFFEVMESSGQREDRKDVAPFPVTINAMDGGTIVR